MLKTWSLLLLLCSTLFSSAVGRPTDSTELASEETTQEHAKIMVAQMMASLNRIGKRGSSATPERNGVGHGLLHQVHLLESIFRRQRSEADQDRLALVRNKLAELGR